MFAVDVNATCVLKTPNCFLALLSTYDFLFHRLSVMMKFYVPMNFFSSIETIQYELNGILIMSFSAQYPFSWS